MINIIIMLRLSKTCFLRFLHLIDVGNLHRINVKLGGINSHPVSGIYEGLNTQPTMVVGGSIRFDSRDSH
jgi:hypothetical protein